MSLSNFSGVNHRKWTAAFTFQICIGAKSYVQQLAPSRYNPSVQKGDETWTPKWPAAAVRTGGKRLSLAHLSEVVISSGVWPFGPMGNTGLRLCMRPMSAIQFPPEPHGGPVPHEANLYVTRTYITRTVGPKDSYNKRTLNSVNILPLPPSSFKPVTLSHKRAQSIKEGG